MVELSKLAKMIGVMYEADHAYSILYIGLKSHKVP